MAIGWGGGAKKPKSAIQDMQTARKPAPKPPKVKKPPKK